MRVKDGEAGAAPGRQGSSSAAGGRLRLQVSADIGEVVAITLEALVPGFADAAVIHASESLFQNDQPAVARPLRPDPSGRIVVRRAGSRFAWGGPAAEDFPPDEIVAFTGDSPYARCASGGRAVTFTRPSAEMLEQAGSGGREALSRYTSFLAVPLKADDAVVGLVALAREPVRPPFSAADIEEVGRIAACTGTGVATAIALDWYRAVSAALQQGLAPTEPPSPERLEIAARSLPAAGHLVGGDWHDFVSLPGGRTGIVAGDVMGHGAEAVVVMAQLRSAARVLAQLDTAPAGLLSRLDRLTETLHGAPMATCVYAVIDPAMESCTLAAAGHLPPVLARPGHEARVLDLPSGMSLGLGETGYGQSSIRLRPGSVLALCTDGLVETRHRSFDQGITALSAELARAADAPLTTARDRIIGALAAAPEDDVTLILARIPASS